MPDTVNVELHCHTNYSMDGMMPVEAVVRAAKRVGLDVLAITDHDTVEGAMELARWARRRGEDLHVITGEERTLEDGSHLIGLFLKEKLYSARLGEVIEEIAAQGGLCLMPHPFRKKDGLLRGGMEPFERHRAAIHGFEIYNAKCSMEVNGRARELLGLGLHPFGGSDAHYDSDLGESLNVVRWQGDAGATVRGMFGGQTAVRVFGKPQSFGSGERQYAPMYYRIKRHAKLPRFLLPGAKAAYRCYRNWRYGVGMKNLVEVYARA